MRTIVITDQVLNLMATHDTCAPSCAGDEHDEIMWIGLQPGDDGAPIAEEDLSIGGGLTGILALR